MTPSTKLEYKKELIRRSAEGLFPARERGTTTCSYRCRDEVRMCAVGICIPDHNYTYGIEGQGYHPSKADNPVAPLVVVPQGCSPEQLAQLQCCHDVMADRFQWDHEEFVKQVEEILGS